MSVKFALCHSENFGATAMSRRFRKVMGRPGFNRSMLQDNANWRCKFPSGKQWSKMSKMTRLQRAIAPMLLESLRAGGAIVRFLLSRRRDDKPFSQPPWKTTRIQAS